MKKTHNTKSTKTFHIFFFFILLSLSDLKIAAAQKQLYKCGPDNGPIYKINISNIREYKDPERKRDLEGEGDNGFKNLSIYLDTTYFEQQIEQNNLTNNKNFYINGMKKAIKTLESLLKVKIPSKNYVILYFNYNH